MKRAAVVILNWNGKKLLEQFLPSVIQNSPEAEIYVADNASTDDSVDYIVEHYPDIKIIRNNENYGYAKGYNEALKYVEEPLYVLLNSDVEVTQNWLSPMIELFDTNQKIAIAQPKIKDYKNKRMFEYAGAAGGYIDKYGFPFCRGRIFDTIEKDNGQYDDRVEIFWASGACFFIRKEVFWQLNGFDEDFFAHQEEIDLCWRAFNTGYRSFYCPESAVYHLGGATLQNTSPRKTFLNFRNSLWMMLKNLPPEKLFPVLFIRLSFDGMAGIHFLLQGKPAHLWAVLKSHFYFYLRIFHFLTKRKSTHYGNYYKINSIVHKYFVKNGKKFDSVF